MLPSNALAFCTDMHYRGIEQHANIESARTQNKQHDNARGTKY